LRDLLRGASVCLLAAMLVIALDGCGQQPVALVNGQKVTRTEFITRLKQAAGKAVLADLIFRRLVDDEFAKSGLQATDQEIAERLAELKQEFPSEEAFAQWMQSVGLTEPEMLAEIRHQIKLEKLRTKDVKVVEADIKKFFEENRERYDKRLRVVLSQIVVSSEQEADKVHAELKKPGANFGALARQYSIDAMFRARGGRLPELPMQQLTPPDLQPVVAKMQVGSISAPVRVDDNWFIIKLEERKAPEKATFEKVRSRVERDYRIIAAKPKENLYRELAEKAVVQVLDPDLAEVQEMFVPRQELPQFGGTKPAPGAPAQGQQPPAGGKPGAAAPAPQPQGGAAAPGGAAGR